MTNKEVFEKLFNITIEQLRKMSKEEVIKWENEINKILWGGFNGEKKCCNCKSFDYDELWDGEEEIQFFYCDKEHYDHISWDAEPCEDYEEYKE